MKKVFFSLLVYLSFIGCVSATVCEESVEFKEYSKLSDSEKSNTNPPIKYICTTESSKKQSSISNLIELTDKNDVSLSISTSDSYFNATEYIDYIDIENQESLPICWIHTSNTVLAVNGYKDGLDMYNFSEKHVDVMNSYNLFTDTVNVHGYNKVQDEGGTAEQYAGYLFKHLGPIFQSDYAYNTFNLSEYNNLLSTDVPTNKGLIDVDTYANFYSTEGCTSNKINLIKELLISRGSVGASVYSLNMSLKTNYMYIGKEPVNHAITIVGWDDNYPGSKFGEGISDGAWIIRNSWGTSVGKNGYQYVSYNDSNICNEAFVYDGVKVNDYDNTYYSSELFSNTTYPIFNKNQVGYSIKFTANNSEEYLSKVSFNSDVDMKYEVYYSKTSPNDYSHYLGSRETNYYGISSVSFDPIKVNGDFYINIIQYNLDSTDNSISVPTTCKANSSNSSYAYLSDLEDNTNFIVNDNEVFDLNILSGTLEGIYHDNCRLNIYAYTTNTKNSSAAINITSLSGDKQHENEKNDISVKFTYSRLNDPRLIKIRVYNKENKDVSSNFDINKTLLQNGTITFKNNNAKAGEYNISLEYSNIRKTQNFIIYENITSNKYTINEKNVLVKPNLNGITINEFKSNISTSSDIKLYYANGLELGINDNLGTGTYFTLNGNKYTIIVGGDINGDGAINSGDLAAIIFHKTGKNVLHNEYLIAADINKDNDINSGDLAAIIFYKLGKKEIW